jgi:hypothetical protein
VRRDLLEADKRKLLDEVKTPAEVEAVISAGMKKMSEVEGSFETTLKELEEAADKKIALIVVPDEIKAALAEIDHQRMMVNAELVQQQKDIFERIRTAKNEIGNSVEAQTKDVFDALAQRKAEIEAEFAGKSEAVDENIKKLTEEIKAEVKTLGHSVKGDHYQGVYMNGRITWDTKAMDGYAVGHPEVLFMRKEGEPSVTLRRI